MAEVKVKEELDDADVVEVEHRILALCQRFPQGITDQVVQNDMPHLPTQQRAAAVNRLLKLGRLELQVRKGKPVFVLKDTQKTACSKMKGSDLKEKLVYQIVEDAGNKGLTSRVIRLKSNLLLPELNAILKNLESKTLIKAVRSSGPSASASAKLYMLHRLQPDVSVTRAAFYADQVFVNILGQQCYKFLQSKAEAARSPMVQGDSQQSPMVQRDSQQSPMVQGDSQQSPIVQRDSQQSPIVQRDSQQSPMAQRDSQQSPMVQGDSKQSPMVQRDSKQSPMVQGDSQQSPIVQRNRSYASPPAVWKYIRELGISKQEVSMEEIEALLNMLIRDGKVEMTTVAVKVGTEGSVDGQMKLYRAVSPTVQPAGLVRAPCGVCPVFDECRTGFEISPSTCLYMKEWLDI